MRSLRIVDATHRLFRAPEVTFHASEIGLTAFGYNVRNADLVDALEQRVAECGIPRIETSVERVSAEPDEMHLHLAVGRDGNRPPGDRRRRPSFDRPGERRHRGPRVALRPVGAGREPRPRIAPQRHLDRIPHRSGPVHARTASRPPLEPRLGRPTRRGRRGGSPPTRRRLPPRSRRAHPRSSARSGSTVRGRPSRSRA